MTLSTQSHSAAILFMLACSMAGLLSIGCGGKASGTSPQTSIPADTLTWLKQTAQPISSVEPSASDAELTFLDALVGDASIIGMGEATHGSSEFQKMKHRIFRYLVEHKGVTAFGLEAQAGACQAINQYVLTGEGDPIKLVKGQGFWVWSTQEMVDLVIWMRAYNNDPAHVQKLRFFGFDMQDGGMEMDQVLAYLQPIDPTACIHLTELYAPFRPYTFNGGRAPYVSTARVQCHANLLKAYQWMVDHQATCVAATGPEAYARALQMAKVAIQSEALQALPNPSWDSLNSRDLSMADNVDWFCQQLGTGTKVMLSSHNGHINKTGTSSSTYTSTGSWLSSRHGTAYVSIGFAFNSGGLTAKPVLPDGSLGQVQFNLAPRAGIGSYENAFVQAGIRSAFLDMRNLNHAQPGPAWLFTPHDLREIGSVWKETPGYGVTASSLPTRFDALIFIDTVTGTNLLP